MPDDTISERERWNERYRTDDHQHEDDDPAEFVRDALDWLPGGRVLDAPTGTGRHALCFAEHGYEVDAVDISDEGLTIAQRRAAERGLDVNWIQADLADWPLPEETYAVICVVGYYDMALLERLPDALVQGGILLYEHHLGPAAIADRGPRTDEFRAESNEVLHACLDLTILEYREWSKTYDDDAGEIDPRVTLVARNGLDGEPWYPPAR